MKKADLVLKNVMYLDSKQRKFIKANIAIKDGIIVGINEEFEGEEEKDLEGKYLTPGFIDGHIHLESSMATPENFAKIAVKHGTTTEIADPHEIVNVLGTVGFYYMYSATNNIPQDVYFMLPSCVPATKFDISAGKFGPDEIEKLFELKLKRVLGLAEVMNAPGVIYGDQELKQKIESAYSRDMIIDGHSPGIAIEDFKKYVKKGHITSDHECTTYEEALAKIHAADEVHEEELQEKLEILKKNDPERYNKIIKELEKSENRLEKAEELGLIRLFRIMIRYGTAAKDADQLQALFFDKDYEKFKNRLLLVTDDKNIKDLIEEGEIDSTIRKLISYGVPEAEAYISATTNGANYFKLEDRGEIAVGKKADLVVLDNLRDVEINSVYKDGQEMTDERINEWESPKIDEAILNAVENTIHLPEGKEKIEISDITSKDIKGKNQPRKIIGLIPEQIITEDAGITNDYDLDNDILKIAVMDIHAGTGKISYAYIKGSGLKKGAVASTIAHDSHYLVAVGTNDEDLLTAMNNAIEMHGGLVYAQEGKPFVNLKLEKAGLFSGSDPKSIGDKLQNMKKIDMTEGIDVMTFAFSALSVIPKLKQLPIGTFEFDRFNVIPQEEINKKWYEMQVGDSTQADDGTR